MCRHLGRPYPRCPDCGGQVVDLAKPGRLRETLRGIHVAVPDDFRIPTCVDCGEESMMAEVSNPLDRLLLAKISEALRVVAPQRDAPSLSPSELERIGREVRADYAQAVEATAEGELLNELSRKRHRPVT